MDTKDRIIENLKKQVSHYKIYALKNDTHIFDIKWRNQREELESELTELKKQREEEKPIEQPAPVKSDIDDLKQYITNLLYYAFEEGSKHGIPSQFDKWVEEMIEDISEYHNQPQREVNCESCEYFKIGYGHCNWCIHSKQHGSFQDNYRSNNSVK